jgi:hypothetical protein
MTVEEPAATPPRTSVLPRVLAAVVVIGAVIAGVIVLLLFVFGDDKSSQSDLTTYLQQVEQTMVDISNESGETQVQDPEAAMPAIASVIKNNAEELDQVDVPGQAQGAHEDLVAALFAASDAILDLSREERVTDINTVLPLISADPDVQAAYNDAAVACQDLQKLADENEIEVSLSFCAAPAATTPG